MMGSQSKPPSGIICGAHEQLVVIGKGLQLSIFIESGTACYFSSSLQ